VSRVDWEAFPLFAGLEPSDQERLGALLEERPLAPGETLCAEGAAAEGAFLLASGALDCRRERLGALGRIEAPALLGIAALAEEGRREASLRAAEPSRVLVLTRAAFERFAAEAPPAALRVLGAALRELAGVLRGSVEVLPRQRG
jgi:CRP-like cAMP-binding protein